MVKRKAKTKLSVAKSRRIVKGRTKPVNMFKGMDKLFTQKTKYSSKAHQGKGSTWLKSQNPLKRPNKVGRMSASI